MAPVEYDEVMDVVFDGLVFTSYGQLTLTTGQIEPPLPDQAFIGQTNGLCGASVAGALFLVTGTHTGEIPVRISLWDSAPEIRGWEEAVEVSLVPAGEAAFAGWADDPVVRFELPAPSYRARWNATAMDAADTEDQVRDSYELMLWPAPPSPDAILHRTSARAGYWHDQGFSRQKRTRAVWTQAEPQAMPQQRRPRPS